MTDSGDLALIHAEIDGELNPQQRAELARRLLSSPDARALRDDLVRLCKALDELAAVEPPAELRKDILDALPQSTPVRKRPWASAPLLRYAALFAGVLVAGTVVYQIVRGPGSAATEVAGTIAARPGTAVDSVRLGSGPVSGQVILYRDDGGLSLALELVANAPVDLLITNTGHMLRVNGLRPRGDQGMPPTAVALPGFGTDEQAVNVAFFMGGRQVGSVNLRVPKGR